MPETHPAEADGLSTVDESKRKPYEHLLQRNSDWTTQSFSAVQRALIVSPNLECVDHDHMACKVAQQSSQPQGRSDRLCCSHVHFDSVVDATTDG